ncbi:hypothetical protein GCM10009836_49980 [Pseudonocardia ailaonensis]|uniref:AB hydrolase-1 domain-containing protein n=1 Tax=Pseudonocardia ailaonensis TaxID=367279 RepID=A0ABN2NGU4_9PSEU
MKLHTETRGDGPRRVALVHGLGVRGAMWGSLADRIAATGASVTTVDLRGHGASPRADHYTADDMAADLVETLPTGLDVVMGHSLGGAVLVRAAAALAPARAVYLDPGFRIGLPTKGLAGKLFWAAPALSLGLATLASTPARRKREAAYSPEDRALLAESRAGLEKRLAVDVFRDIAHHPFAAAPPAVPSTVVLSADGSQVVPDALATELEGLGWEIRRVPTVHHEFWVEDFDATWDAIQDRV